jgi:hypothetical protein
MREVAALLAVIRAAPPAGVLEAAELVVIDEAEVGKPARDPRSLFRVGGALRIVIYSCHFCVVTAPLITASAGKSVFEYGSQRHPLMSGRSRIHRGTPCGG